MENEFFAFKARGDVSSHDIILNQLLHIQEIQLRQELMLALLLRKLFPEDDEFNTVISSINERAKEKKIEIMEYLVRIYGE